jgi:type I restriction enzyme S subunit
MTNLEREATELTEMSFSRWQPYPEYQDSGVEWFGEIPSHWTVKKLKFVLEFLDHKRVPLSGEERADLEKVYPYYGASGIIDYVHDYLFDETLILVAEDGANLFSRSTPLAFLATGKYWVNNHAHILRPKSSPIEYWSYLLASIVYDPWISGSAQPKLTKDRLGSIELTTPSDAERHVIAVFLDRETTKIDALIAKKRELIALLQEQRSAIISHTVTKGLNPHAPMKDSGIEWLGEIPAHWTITRSKRLFLVRHERARDDDQQLSATQAYGVIPQEEFEQRVGRQVVKIFKNLEQRSHVEQDDFVISMRSFQGGLERAWARGCIRSSYVVLKPTSSVDVEFFMYLFKSASYIQALQATADFIRDGQDLTFRNFSLVDLPLIPIDEQRAIAQYLSKTTREIDQLIEKTSETIDRLQEYRSALISAAVTGKIDVRGEVS